MIARSAFFVMATLTLFWLGRVESAFAEPTAWDQTILRAAQANPAAGLVFLEANSWRTAGLHPRYVRRSGCGSYRTRAKRRFFSPRFRRRYSGMRPIVRHTAAERCWPPASTPWRSYGARVRLPFQGNSRRFAVQAGQVLNLGCLVIEYRLGPLTLFEPRRDSGEWRVEDLSPRALASLSEEAPVAFSKATKRYMTPVRLVSRPKTQQ